MCGRYAFFDFEDIYETRKILEDIAATFGKQAANAVKKGEIFPTETAATLCQTEGTPQAKPLRWGYIIQGSKSPLINARFESIFDKPFFSKNLIYKKCLIPANSFYEWETKGKLKIKHTISIENKPFFYMCGLYAPFTIGNKTDERFVIITKDANEKMRAIHNRMPLILPEDLKNAWLTETKNIRQIADLIFQTEIKLNIA